MGSNLAYQSDETGDGSADAVITIMSVGNTSVSGTLHGTMLIKSGTGTAQKVAANGQFDVPF
jgi:hypothetical protein